MTTRSWVRPAVDHEVLQQGLRLEAEALEGGDRARLIRGHLRHDLPQAELTGDQEDLPGQGASQPPRAVARTDLNADLSEVALPGNLVVVEARITGEVAIGLREHRDGSTRREVLHPLRDDLGVGDVRPEKEQVYLGERPRERQDAVGVRRSHQSQGGGSVVVESDRAGVLAREPARRLAHGGLLP